MIFFLQGVPGGYGQKGHGGVKVRLHPASLRSQNEQKWKEIPDKWNKTTTPPKEKDIERAFSTEISQTEVAKGIKAWVTGVFWDPLLFSLQFLI